MFGFNLRLGCVWVWDCRSGLDAGMLDVASGLDLGVLFVGLNTLVF